jgi:hypothetical protein
MLLDLLLLLLLLRVLFRLMLLQLLLLVLCALLLAARFVSQRSRCRVWVQPPAITKHLQPSTSRQQASRSQRGPAPSTQCSAGTDVNALTLLSAANRVACCLSGQDATESQQL